MAAEPNKVRETAQLAAARSAEVVLGWVGKGSFTICLGLNAGGTELGRLCSGDRVPKETGMYTKKQYIGNEGHCRLGWVGYSRQVLYSSFDPVDSLAAGGVWPIGSQ